MGRLDGKAALITGSGSGIGRATAVIFAKEGAEVAVNDVSEKGGQETIQMIKQSGGVASFFKADVTRSDQVKKMVEEVSSKFGRINVLHNNVGGWQVQVQDTVTRDSEEEWDRLVNLNLKGTFLVSKEVIPRMIKSGGGSIINTITTNAYMNNPGMAAYGSAKGGVRELTRAMALDYARDKIRVNGLVPGEVRTPQWEATYASMKDPEKGKEFVIRKIPLGRFAEPEDIALGALFLASDESRYVTGHILFVDGGLTAGFYEYFVE